MKQILVAVDEHPHAQKIVDSAIQLAEAMSAKIILIYVVTSKRVPGGYVNASGETVSEAYVKDLSERTVYELAKSVQKADIKYEGVFETGDPTKMILKTAKSKDVSYIVVGVRGFHYLSRVKAIGNVARNVIENSPVPVLSVP